MLTGSSEGREAARALAQFGSLGFTLVAGVAVLSAAGAWLDRQLGTDPWLLVVGCLTGGVAGLYKLIRDFTRLCESEQDRSD